MTTIDKKMMRERLDVERKRLQDELSELVTKVRPADESREGSPFGKREEEAAESQELEQRMALEIRTHTQLTSVERALQKLDQGTYGKCDICGSSIEVARLEAYPAANQCMKCKAKGVKPK